MEAEDDLALVPALHPRSDSASDDKQHQGTAVDTSVPLKSLSPGVQNKVLTIIDQFNRVRQKSDPMLELKLLSFKTGQIDVHAFHILKFSLDSWVSIKRRLHAHGIYNGRVCFDSQPLHQCNDCTDPEMGGHGSVCVEIPAENTAFKPPPLPAEDPEVIKLPDTAVANFQRVVKDQLDWPRILNILLSLYRYFPLSSSCTVKNLEVDAYRLSLNLKSTDVFPLRILECIYDAHTGWLRQTGIWVNFVTQTLEIDVIKHNAKAPGKFTIMSVGDDADEKQPAAHKRSLSESSGSPSRKRARLAPSTSVSIAKSEVEE